MLNKAVFFLATIIFISSFSSVFAEVSHLQIDRDLYFENDSIYLDGVVTSDSSGLVTIVLRDPDNQFVFRITSYNVCYTKLLRPFWS